MLLVTFNPVSLFSNFSVINVYFIIEEIYYLWDCFICWVIGCVYFVCLELNLGLQGHVLYHPIIFPAQNCLLKETKGKFIHVKTSLPVRLDHGTQEGN